MKKLLFVFAGLAFALTAAAQEFRITHGPYLCDMSQDGVTVVWTTSRPALSWVEASPADSLAPAPPQPRHYQTVAGRKLAGRTLHAVRVRGLQPGTDYRYRIFSQEVLSWPDVNNVTYGKTVGADASRRRAYGFRTFPAAGSGCSFLVLNDIHGKADVLTRLCKRVDFSELGFVAFNGDMSSSVESGEQLFKDYLDASAALFAAGTPILFTRGNHETRGIYADHLPEYFPKVGGNYYKLYMAGSVAVLLLDCGEDKPDSDIRYYGLSTADAYREQQAQWLRGVVAGEEFRSAPYRIVLIHMPPNKGRGWHGELEIERLFLPILDGSGIDLMLCGHYHRYQWIDDLSRGADFPILINSNNDKTVVKADEKGIDIRVVDTAGNVLKEHKITKNNR